MIGLYYAAVSRLVSSTGTQAHSKGFD